MTHFKWREHIVPYAIPSCMQEKVITRNWKVYNLAPLRLPIMSFLRRTMWYSVTNSVVLSRVVVTLWYICRIDWSHVQAALTMVSARLHTQTMWWNGHRWAQPSYRILSQSNHPKRQKESLWSADLFEGHPMQGHPACQHQRHQRSQMESAFRFPVLTWAILIPHSQKPTSNH